VEKQQKGFGERWERRGYSISLRYFCLRERGGWASCVWGKPKNRPSLEGAGHSREERKRPRKNAIKKKRGKL